MDRTRSFKGELLCSEPVSVFETPDAFSDVTFEVEGRHLHFSRHLLRTASPVFDRMFTSEFREKESRVVPLPGKKMKDIDIFLQNIHPAHLWKPLDDDKLQILLPLADEYQVDHIFEKCNHYIAEQLRTNSGEDYKGSIRSTKLKPPVLLQYLHLCKQYELKKCWKSLLQHVSLTQLKDLENDSIYNALSDATKIAILRMRCMHLEKRVL